MLDLTIKRPEKSMWPAFFCLFVFSFLFVLKKIEFGVGTVVQTTNEKTEG